jgi:hypothetical protein
MKFISASRSSLSCARPATASSEQSTPGNKRISIQIQLPGKQFTLPMESTKKIKNKYNILRYLRNKVKFSRLFCPFCITHIINVEKSLRKINNRNTEKVFFAQHLTHSFPKNHTIVNVTLCNFVFKKTFDWFNELFTVIELNEWS